MTKLSVLVVAVMYVGTLVGCASTPPPPPPPPKAAAPPAPQIPSWVDSPYLEGGLVSSECVRNYKGQRSILISKAKLVARGELASQIETNVKAMAKDFAQLTETADGMVSGQDFERVLKQITDQNLMGSRLEASWVSSSGTYYAMVSLGAAGLVDAISADQTLPEDVRVEVAKRAEASFAELAAAVDTSEASESTGAPAE